MFLPFSEGFLMPVFHPSVAERVSECLRLMAVGSNGNCRWRTAARRSAAVAWVSAESLECRTLLAGNFGYATVFKPTVQTGSPAGEGNGIAVDSAGNSYVTGSFTATYGFGGSGIATVGGKDIYVTKLDPLGAQVWIRRIGSTGDESGQGITIDASGDVFVSGFFSGTVDFDPSTTSTFNLTSAGGTDSFVLQLNNNGGFVAAARLGGTGTDQGLAIAVDPVNGEIVTTGFFSGTVTPGNGGPAVTSNGGEDIFVSILSPGALLNQTFFKMGGTTNDRGLGVAIENVRDVFVTGSFTGTADFDPNSGTFNLVSAGLDDAFVVRLDGSNFVWATRAGSVANDSSRGIDLDAEGNVYTTGRFEGTVDFNGGSGTFNQTSSGSADAYVLKQDSLGAFVYARQMGGIGPDDARGISVDEVGNVYTTGSFQQTARFGAGTSAPVLKATNTTAANFNDIFVAKQNSTGTFVFARAMGGGDSAETGFAIAVNGDGSIYSTGIYNRDADFDPGVGVQTRTSFGSLGFNSIYVSHLTPDLFSPSGNSSQTMRKNGSVIELINNGTGLVVASTLLSETRSIVVSTVTSLKLDFSSGGSFAVPNGVQFNGFSGNDIMELIGVGTEAFTFQPSTTSGRGTILAYGQKVDFTGLDTLLVSKSLGLIIEPQGSADILTVEHQAGDLGEEMLITGTTGGTAITPIAFAKIANVTIDTGARDGSVATSSDSITMAAGSLEADGLTNLTIRTGKGNDTLFVNGPDVGLPVPGGAFWFLGGGGVDRLTAVGDVHWNLNDTRLISSGGGRIQIDDIEKASLTGGASNNNISAVGFSGDATLDGGNGNDLIRGGFGDDLIFGGAGNDRVWCGDGDDTVFAQSGNDVLYGENGADTLKASSGLDQLFGGDGDDFLFGEADNDELYGGNGSDRVNGGTGNDLLYGESGNDLVEGDDGNDILDGGTGNDTLVGGIGIDLYVLGGTANGEDLALQRLSATSAVFKRKPRGLVSVLEQDTITMDATDEFFINALGGDDLISIDVALTQLGSVDGGDGSDSCTAPAAWTKVSC
jgi:Ca2+-binding RTX toxin-like protein